MPPREGRPGGGRGNGACRASSDKRAVLDAHVLGAVLQIAMPEGRAGAAVLHVLYTELQDFIIETAAPHTPHEINQCLRFGIVTFLIAEVNHRDNKRALEPVLNGFFWLPKSRHQTLLARG